MEGGGGTALPLTGIQEVPKPSGNSTTARPAPRVPSRRKRTVNHDSAQRRGGNGRLLPSGVPRLPVCSKPSLSPPRLPRCRQAQTPPFQGETGKLPWGGHRVPGRSAPCLSPRAPATPTGGRRAGLGDDARSLQPACGQGVPIGCVRRNRLGPERGGLRAERATGVTRAAQRPTFVGICKTEKPKRRTTE